MDLKQRADLVREFRFEIKQAASGSRSREPRNSDRDFYSFANRVGPAVNTDSDVYEANENWDRHYYRQPKRIRRTMRPVPLNSEYTDYSGYNGLSRSQKRRAIAGGASYRATFGKN